MFYTVPWFVELGPDRQVPGKVMAITQMAMIVCNREPPMPYGARVNLFFLESGLDYDLCRYAVWLALELEMLTWCDAPDLVASLGGQPLSR